MWTHTFSLATAQLYFARIFFDQRNLFLRDVTLRRFPIRSSNNIHLQMLSSSVLLLTLPSLVSSPSRLLLVLLLTALLLPAVPLLLPALLPALLPGKYRMGWGWCMRANKLRAYPLKHIRGSWMLTNNFIPIALLLALPPLLHPHPLPAPLPPALLLPPALPPLLPLPLPSLELTLSRLVSSVLVSLPVLLPSSSKRLTVLIL